MSGVSVTQHPPPLRRDLHSVKVDGRPRAYRIVIDEISGRFTRVSEHVWNALNRGDHDESVWREATAADWTRERTRSRRKQFSPLYFRIPLGSVDQLAKAIAPATGLVFSPTAVLFWCALVGLAAALAASRGNELLASLGSLQTFLQQSDPVWLGVLFVGTKIAHELAHAVMCRRMGSRCKSAGLLFLVGVPCPYCDVTDIWRQPSAIRRTAVMLAGIYIELIIATVATFVWVGATDPAIRLHALNLMVVCGVSTLVFNANPLMRYDGYYVLGDLVGSTNLRQEARDAFRSVVTVRIAGTGYRHPSRRDLRTTWLAVFHAASAGYRFVISIAIATLLLEFADYLHLRPIAIGLIVIAVIAAVGRLARRVTGIARGSDRWINVPPARRFGLLMGTGLVVLVVFLIPLPRYRSATGWVDAADASSVYLPSDGIVESVPLDVGHIVRTGEPLVRLRSESLSIQIAKLRGQLRVAKLRSSLSRRVTLDRTETAGQWKTLQAAEDSVAASLASVQQRLGACEVTAPLSGVVLPATAEFPTSSSTPLSLRERVGRAADAHDAWCRISPGGTINAVLVIDARDRTNIDVGATVRINLCESPETVFFSSVASVSAIEHDEPSVTRQAAFQVLCPLPDVEKQEMLRWMGKRCKGVFHLPHRTLASNVGQWVSEWLGGK